MFFPFEKELPELDIPIQNKGTHDWVIGLKTIHCCPSNGKLSRFLWIPSCPPFIHHHTTDTNSAVPLLDNYFNREIIIITREASLGPSLPPLSPVHSQLADQFVATCCYFVKLNYILFLSSPYKGWFSGRIHLDRDFADFDCDRSIVYKYIWYPCEGLLLIDDLLELPAYSVDK